MHKVVEEVGLYVEVAVGMHNIGAVVAMKFIAVVGMDKVALREAIERIVLIAMKVVGIVGIEEEEAFIKTKSYL